MTDSDGDGEKDALELRSDLERLERVLASTIHDLKSPLSIIVMNSKMLEEQEIGPLNDVQTRVVSAICRRSDFMNQLIDQFREYASLSYGAPPLTDKVPSDLLGLVEDIIADLPDTVRRSVVVDFDTARNLPQPALSPELIKRAISLLLGYSLDRPTEGNQTKLRFFSDGSSVSLSCTFEGNQLSEEDLQRAFEPFEPRFSRENATGLELAIANGVVEAHRGQVKYRQSGDNEHTVRLRLPV